MVARYAPRRTVFCALLVVCLAALGAFAAAPAHAALVWQPQVSGTTADLNDVCFVSATTGWAVGDAGTLLTTTDGGQHWASVTLSTSVDLTTIAFSDAQTGWLAGAGFLARTTDGGATWSSVTPPAQMSVTPQLDCVGAGEVWLTGESQEMKWFDGYFSFASGQDPAWDSSIAQALVDVASVWHSADAGTTWQLATSWDGVATDITCGNGAVWASGLWQRHVAWGFYMDFGDWQYGDDPVSSGVEVSEAAPCVAHSSGLGIASWWSTDAVAAWSEDVSSVYSVRSVAAVDGAAWCVDSKGRVKAEGTSAWAPLAALPEFAVANGIALADSSHGWLVCRAGAIFATGDGGATWQLSGSGVSQNLNAVDFRGLEHGWAVGDGGVIVSSAASALGLPTTTLHGVEDGAWYNHDVTITMTAEDVPGGPGIAGTEYQLSGGAPWMPGGQFTVTAGSGHTQDFLHSVGYRATTKDGRVEDARWVKVGIDTTAPVTYAESVYWGVNRRLDPTDPKWPNASGVAATTFRIDGGAWQAGDLVVPSSSDHSGDGRHTIEFFSTDAAGNVEATKSRSILIDTVPPVVTAPVVSTWYQGAVSLPLSAQDPQLPGDLPGSGCPYYNVHWRTADDYESWDGVGTIRIPDYLPEFHSTDGIRRVEYWAIDDAGNSTPVTTLVLRIDTLAPTTTLIGADDLWHRKPVTLDLRAVDTPGRVGVAGSGVATTGYRCGTGPEVVGTRLAVPAPADHSGDGVQSWSYRSIDVAGNCERAKIVDVKIDTTGPVCVAKAAAGRAGHAIALPYRATDALSAHIRGFRVVVRNRRGTVVRSWTAGPLVSRLSGVWYTFKWTPKASGTYRYSVFGKDEAGNAQTVAGSAKVVVR